MRRAAIVALFVLSAALGALALAGNTPMMFLVDEAQWANRDIRVVAFSTVASDFELRARPVYLADLGMYLYQVRSKNLVPPYDTAPMVLWGEGRDGAVLCAYFTPSPNLMQKVAWAQIPAPTVTLAGTTATVSWTLPSLPAQAVDRWRLIVDGNAQALPTSPWTHSGLAPGPHTYALRLVAVGSPKAHRAHGPTTTVEVVP